MHGAEGVRFYTKLKTVTSRWPSGIQIKCRIRHANNEIGKENMRKKIL